MSEHGDQTGKPGSAGEHALQQRFGSFRRAASFYDHQMLDHLNPLMLEYLARQEMAFIATADANGECDCSFRAGPAGFIRALDERTVIYPEFRGNGVMGSLGNMAENPHVGILFVDFYDSAVGLHINGKAHLVEDASLRALWPLIAPEPTQSLPEGTPGAKGVPERWVLVRVEEAYIHCSKHIPLMTRRDKEAEWASGEAARPGGDFFRAKHSPRPWRQEEPDAVPAAASASDQASAVTDPAAAPTAALASAAPAAAAAAPALAPPTQATAAPAPAAVPSQREAGPAVQPAGSGHQVEAAGFPHSVDAAPSRPAVEATVGPASAMAPAWTDWLVQEINP